MRLYLIRHGETEYNRTRRMQGHAEIPLNDAGIRQAALMARRMAETPPDKIISSDLRRAAMTATILAAETGAPLLFDEGFRERDPGELTHQPYDDVMAFFTDPEYAPPGGEDVPNFVERVDIAFQGLVQREGATDAKIAVVSHGMVCGAFLRVCFRKSREEIAEVDWPNTCITIADYDGQWTLVSLADGSHLDAER